MPAGTEKGSMCLLPSLHVVVKIFWNSWCWWVRSHLLYAFYSVYLLLVWELNLDSRHWNAGQHLVYGDEFPSRLVLGFCPARSTDSVTQARVQLIIWKRERDGNMVDLFLAGWLELQLSVMQPYGVWDEMCLNQWEKSISVIAQGSGETSSTILGVITLVRPYSRCSTWLHGWCRAFCIGRIQKSLAYFPC